MRADSEPLGHGGVRVSGLGTGSAGHGRMATPRSGAHDDDALRFSQPKRLTSRARAWIASNPYCEQ
jgi:hypothetical protein